MTNTESVAETPRPPRTGEERYQTILALLTTILEELAELRGEVDDLDRGLRPYGDGFKPPRRRR